MAKEMLIEKSVSINKNINEVFAFLKQTKNQDKFSVWNMKDPAMKNPNPNYEGRPSVQALIEGARLGSASLDLRGEDVQTDAEIVRELLDHVERGYGEATAVGEIDTVSGARETVYNTALGGSTELNELDADPESGEVSRENLVEELSDPDQAERG